MQRLKCENIIYGLPPELESGQSIALDLELSGLNENQLHRPAGRFLSLAGSFDGKTAYIIFEDSQIQEFLNRISKAVWVFHNSTFDIGHLRRWATVEDRYIRDTMLIEKILWADYYDGFGLSDLVRRYLKCYMDKDVRKDFHDLSGSMTSKQIEYAALDVIGTWLVDQEQQKIMEEKDRQIWDKIDMPTVWISVGLSGFTVDKNLWTNIAETHGKIKEELEADLGQKYGKNQKKLVGRGKNRVEIEEFIPFNPASPSQVLAVFRSYGADVSSTENETLSNLVGTLPPEGEEFLEKMLKYRESAKKSSTYGVEYLQFVEDDGRIYSSLNVIGAQSGRMSSRSPNLQQVPRSEEYRKCFIAGNGRKLVIADYSSQEPRVFAYLTQDEKLIEIFNSGKDIYCEVARFAFGENITKADKERRNQVKSLVLGLMYGLSPYGFSIQNEVDLEVAQEDFDRFFAAFPRAAEWVRARQTVNTGHTVTVLGRKCHLHPYDSQWKRNALNNPIQGTGADMVKIAMRNFKRENLEMFKSNLVGIILPVHDEIILWADESVAEDVKVKLETCMISVAERIHRGIPASVEAHVADSWSEK